MDVPPREPTEKSTVRILITGANSGLGFAICCRLIDEFLITRPQPETLHLMFSTRDTRKSESTLKRLNSHLQTTLRATDSRTPGISRLLEPRIKLEGVQVDLTKLHTVKALAEQLLLRNQPLDAVIWNAGIAGWLGLNYLKATWDFCSGLVQATTYPQYMICDVGALTKPQTRDDGVALARPATPLGQVFTSNVFGHYMLTHWLVPIMDPQTRIIWESSVSAIPPTFDVDDLQGVRSKTAYESSKRLTDLLVLTSDLPSTQREVQAFLPASHDDDRPQMYVTHPGVVQTSIAGGDLLLSLATILAMFLARWVGSPWHPVFPYKGAVSTVFAALAPPSQLVDRELAEGKGKWGSATDVFGNERVMRTEIEGWGFGGELGSTPPGSQSAKRKGYSATTKEMREEFEETGRIVWREMEELRVEWEKILEDVDVGGPKDVNT